MPLSVFFLWLFVGICIAHRLNSLLNPVWAFPAVFLAAWTISSLPISLLRWVRSRRKPAADANKKPVPHFRRYLIPAVAVTLLVPLLFIGWHNLKYPKPLSADVQLSWDKNKDAVVPLTVKNGGIFVVASLNGEEQLCQVDTGSDSVTWFRDLHVEGEMTQERGQTCDALNNCVSSATVKVPKIRIGGYKVTDLPTEMLDSESGLFSSSPTSFIDTTPLLGNALFSQTVVTIDYQRKILTIRLPTYDLTKQPHRPGDQLLQMGWTSHSEDSPARQQVFGWPVIRARAYGKPFWCMIDTGWEGPELGITQDFLRQLPVSPLDAKNRTVGHFAYGDGSVPQFNRLNFQVVLLSPHTPPVVLSGKGWILKSLSGGEGIVGTNLMKHYRITIDYPRRRVLLEPYTHQVSE